MFFSYGEKSTYEKNSGKSANEIVEIYKHLKFTDGTELAFINNHGSYNNGYDSENNYNSNVDNYVYWGDDFIPDGRCILFRTFRSLECWTEDTFKLSDENVTPPELFKRMIQFFQEVYKTVEIDNPISL